MRYLLFLAAALWFVPAHAQIDSTQSIMLQDTETMIDFSMTKIEYLQYSDYQRSGHRGLQAGGGLFLASVLAPVAFLLAARGNPEIAGVAGVVSLACVLGGSVSLLSAGNNLKKAQAIQRRAVRRNWNKAEGKETGEY